MRSKLRTLLSVFLCLCMGLSVFPVSPAAAEEAACQVEAAESWEEFAASAAALVREGMRPRLRGVSDPHYETARLIVKLEGELPELARFAPTAILRDPENHYLIQLSSPALAAECAAYLETLPGLLYVEPDRLVSLEDEAPEQAAPVVDAATGEDCLARGLASAVSWGVEAVHAAEYAADLKKRGLSPSVIVAVVDSGADSSHPMLHGRLTTGYDFVDGDSEAQDSISHGTHVCGIVADCTPELNIRIMPVRVFGDDRKTSDSLITLGVRYAADHGAGVINLSLGGIHSSYEDEAIEQAIQNGVCVVVSAGNSDSNIDTTHHCPAHLPACITTAAVDSSLTRAYFSNYGSTVDISAPGVDILSAVPGGGYELMSGTSMATPFVSAAAAMLLCEYPGLSPYAVAEALCSAATDSGAPGWDSYCGAGVLNLRPFVQSTSYHTVTYDANGGSGAPASQQKAEKQPLTLSAEKPVRDKGSGTLTLTLDPNDGGTAPEEVSVSTTMRYAFQSWNTERDGSGTRYESSEVYTTDADLTLYAQWNTVPNPKTFLLPAASRTDAVTDGHTLTLDAAGGSLRQDVLTAARVTSYTFLGWNTRPDGSGTGYESGRRYTFREDTTLYAQWTGESTEAAPITLPEPTREGHLFLGWAESADAPRAAFAAGEALRLTGDLTLCALWLDLSAPDGLLPAALETLEDEALASAAFRYVKLPAGLTAIGSRVFDGCETLTAVYVPASVTHIAPDAFAGAPDTLLLLGPAESAIASFAAESGLRFEAVENDTAPVTD